MVAVGFGDKTRLLLFHGFQLFKEIDHSGQIVTALVGILNAEVIGLRLKVAAELHEGGGDQKIQALIDANADWSSNQDQRNSSEAGESAASGPTGGVAGGHVANLMGHDSGQFRFLIGGEYGAGVHVHVTAGQRKGVGRFVIQNFNNERHLGIRITHDVLPDAVDVFGDLRIGDEFRTGIYLPGKLMAHSHLFIQRVPVGKTAVAAYVALPDGVHVVNAGAVKTNI